jgi:hypothetical protein
MTRRLPAGLVAIIAALTLSASVANAAAPTRSSGRLSDALANSHGIGACSDVYGRWWAEAALAATGSSMSGFAQANSR